MSTQTYQVSGMTCEHCVNAVTEEVGRLDGVGAVRVDLASGRLEVDATAPVSADAVRSAVDEAGYQLA